MRHVGAPIRLAIAAIGLVVAISSLGGVRAEAGSGGTATPSVTSRVFAEASPVPVADPLLAVAEVRLDPRATIPPHVHPGTQIGVIAAGDLTYTVLTGEVIIRPANATDDEPSRVVRAGETVVLGVGDAVIENPGAAHRARNDGDEPVVIWLSTLFPSDAPRAIPVEATPSP